METWSRSCRLAGHEVGTPLSDDRTLLFSAEVQASEAVFLSGGQTLRSGGWDATTRAFLDGDFFNFELGFDFGITQRVQFGLFGGLATNVNGTPTGVTVCPSGTTSCGLATDWRFVGVRFRIGLFATKSGRFHLGLEGSGGWQRVLLEVGNSDSLRGAGYLLMDVRPSPVLPVMFYSRLGTRFQAIDAAPQSLTLQMAVGLEFSIPVKSMRLNPSFEVGGMFRSPARPKA